jgi:uncharacterized protein YbjT (DUF2867 family)
MITVMGATGHTGNAIARSLLESGEEVRALGRSESTLASLAGAGAETLAGDASDPRYLTEAFRGAEAVYTLLPIDPQAPDYHARCGQLGEAIVTAVRAAGVPFVVALSSVGADVPTGTGFIAGLHDQEQRLSGLEGTDVLFLRPGFFFENFYASLGVIAEQGVLADSVAPDVRLPMIATRDIATAAAAALEARDWAGVVVRELLGPRDLSYAEAAEIIGAHIGRPDLAYVQVPYADMAAELSEAGFSDDAAARQVEMTRAFNDELVVSREGRTPANTTPTQFEDFAAELAAAYRATEEQLR